MSFYDKFMFSVILVSKLPWSAVKKSINQNLNEKSQSRLTFCVNKRAHKFSSSKDFNFVKYSISLFLISESYNNLTSRIPLNQTVFIQMSKLACKMFCPRRQRNRLCAMHYFYFYCFFFFSGNIFSIVFSQIRSMDVCVHRFFSKIVRNVN